MRRFWILLLLLMPLTVTAVPTSVDIKEFFWGTPLVNTDGSELKDLAGYRIYCIAQGETYPVTGTGYQIADPSATSVDISKVVDVTVNTTYYCKATAYDTDNHEGAFGPEISFLAFGGVAKRNVTVPVAPPSFGVR